MITNICEQEDGMAGLCGGWCSGASRYRFHSLNPAGQLPGSTGRAIMVMAWYFFSCKRTYAAHLERLLVGLYSDAGNLVGGCIYYVRPMISFSVTNHVSFPFLGPCYAFSCMLIMFFLH